jgi:hypothetical protein
MTDNPKLDDGQMVAIPRANVAFSIESAALAWQNRPRQNSGSPRESAGQCATCQRELSKPSKQSLSPLELKALGAFFIG